MLMKFVKVVDFFLSSICLFEENTIENMLKKDKQVLAKQEPSDRKEHIKPEEQEKLIDDYNRFTILEKKLNLILAHISQQMKTEKETQELLVAIATLHEELLNLLDQGKIAMVKISKTNTTVESDVSYETKNTTSKKNQLN